jgi:polyphosphate kinase 2 (PPK2 family)
MGAYEDVIEKTSTDQAPWFVIPADLKWYRDFCVSQIISDALDGMDLHYPKITWDPGEIVVK